MSFMSKDKTNWSSIGFNYIFFIFKYIYLVENGNIYALHKGYCDAVLC